MSDGDAVDVTTASVDAYSAVADDYERRFGERRVQEVGRFARSLPAPARILDVGCGPGRDLARFARHGHRPVGLELNVVFVDRARRHAPVVHGDIRDIAQLFAADSFDGVWADASLVHLDLSAAERAIGHLAGLLRPTGAFFTSVKSSGEAGWVEEHDARRWYSVWDPERLEAVVEAAGCVVEEILAGSYTQVWARRR